MDNIKNDAYYVGKSLADLEFMICNENSGNVVVYRTANHLIVNKVAEIPIKKALS